MKTVVVIVLVSLLVAVVAFMSWDRSDKVAHDRSLSEQKQSRRGN